MKRKYPFTLPPEELREIREVLGMSQTQLAGELGVSFNTYWRWEKGCRGVPGPARMALLLMLKERGLLDE